MANTTPDVRIVDPPGSELDNIQLQINQKQNEVFLIVLIILKSIFMLLRMILTL